MRHAAVMLLLVAASPVGAADTVDFGRDVLPILSDFCFQCHGPDEKARKAKLRLDEKDSARTVITPGKPTESELIARITSTDEDTVMPPPKLKRKLTPQQIDTLKKWVGQGADWGKHWSFEPVGKPAVPVSRDPKGSG